MLTSVFGRHLIRKSGANALGAKSFPLVRFKSHAKHHQNSFVEGELLKQDTFEQIYQRHHIPTSTLQKLMITIGSSLTALSNPLRGDMVASLGETTGVLALENLRDYMRMDPIGAQILHEKPLINEKTINMDKLRSLPEDTFGYAYAKFMDSHGFSPDERSPVRFIDNPELAYIMLRYRQVHDFWHVMSGHETNVMSEIAVKLFEFHVTGLPLCLLSVGAAPVRLDYEQIQVLQKEMFPWARNCAFGLKVNLMNVYYEKHFEENLEEFCDRLGFVPYNSVNE